MDWALELTVKTYYFIRKAINAVLSHWIKKKMSHCGKNVSIDAISSHFAGIERFKMGCNVSIPHGATFYSTLADLIIGNNVMFGPNPTIITGDHRIDLIGKPMFEVHDNDKLPSNDRTVIIEDDVWIGANVTILKGVTIGRGSVIAASSLVNKSYPPYSIIGGIPAKIIRFRFTIDEIIAYEELVYPLEKRISKDKLTQLFCQYYPVK